MRIVVEVDENEPPQGRVEHDPPLEFAGWLGLLQVLAVLLEEHDEA